jgi:RNA polymerase sigma-70 factor (ECF subfamily)
VDGDAQADVVLAAFESLSERDREVLRLVHWESLSTREAAAVLGCSETAMKVRLHRARSRLRRLVNTDSTPGGDAAEPVLDRTDSRMNEGRSRSVPFSASPTYLRMIVVEENVQ